MTFVRIAALVRFIGQLHAALFTDVAIHVEVFVHGDHPDRFFCSFYRGDSFPTTGAFWCKHAMVIINAVDFVVYVHREWNPV